MTQYLDKAGLQHYTSKIKENVVRKVTELPIIPNVNGEIVQYVGTTTSQYTNGYFYKGELAEGERIDSSKSTNMTLTISDADKFSFYKSWLEERYGAELTTLRFVCTGTYMVAVYSNLVLDGYTPVYDPNNPESPTFGALYSGAYPSWIGITFTDVNTENDEIDILFVADPEDPESYVWTVATTSYVADRIRKVKSFPTLPEYENEMVQYIGNTTIDYHHGYFYQSKYESIVIDTSHAGTLNVEVSDQTKFDFYVSWLEERYGGTLEWLKFENTNSYMIATYSNLVDGNYTAVYNPNGDPSTGDLYSGAFPSWVGLTFRNADSNTGNYLTVGVGGNPEDPNSYTWNQVFVQENYPVIDNVTSTSTTSALSANQGKLLQDQINDLKGIGRFLAVWSCENGLPKSEPTTLPYTYKTGDYFIVDDVIVPTPSSATISQTSGTGITAEVDVSTLETFMNLTEDEDLKFWYTDYLCVKSQSAIEDTSIVNVVDTDKFDTFYQEQSQIPCENPNYSDFFGIHIGMYTEYATFPGSSYMVNAYKIYIQRKYYNSEHTNVYNENIGGTINSPYGTGSQEDVDALNAILNEDFGFEFRGNLIVNPVIGGNPNNSFNITKSGVSEWTYGLADVDLTDFGIEMTGSGSADDVLTVEYTAAKHNYRPVGTQYTGEASKTWDAREDTTVRESDVYVFDGTTWTLQYNSSAGAPVQDVQLNGVSVVENKIANIEPEADDVAYSNSAVPSLTTVQAVLDNLVNIHYYVEPRITTFNTDKSGSYERQPSAIEDITFSWTLNKKPESGDVLKITTGQNGTGTLIYDIMANEPATKWQSGTYELSDFTTTNTNKTYYIYYKDNHSTVPSGKSSSASSSTSITFYIKKYYGASELENPTATQIRALTNATSSKALASTSFNFGTGKYWYYCIPKETDTGSALQFSIGPAGSEALQSNNYFIYEINDFENAQGYVVPLRVYKFKKTPAGLPDTLTGTLNVKVA